MRRNDVVIVEPIDTKPTPTNIKAYGTLGVIVSSKKIMEWPFVVALWAFDVDRADVGLFTEEELTVVGRV